jgi:hypothetical protein
MDATGVLALLSLVVPSLSVVAVPVWLFCCVRFGLIVVLSPSPMAVVRSSKLEIFLLIVPFLRVLRLLRLFRLVSGPARAVKTVVVSRRLVGRLV